MLKTLGFNLPYILRVDSVEAPDSMCQDDSPFLVVEQVQPLHMFFTFNKIQKESLYDITNDTTGSSYNINLYMNNQ